MPESPPVTTYEVLSQNKVVSSHEKLKDAKKVARDQAHKRKRATTVCKKVEQRMFTYTPQPAPPPVES